MKLLIIFGPPSVGKMTVGRCIEARTDYKLFHNHAILDGIMHLFGVGTPAEDRLSRLVRQAVIEEAANEGFNLIFTYVWNFALDKGKRNIDVYKQLYEARGGEVQFVELVAPLATRIARAQNPDRHTHKQHTADAAEVARAEANGKSFASPQPFFYPDLYTQLDTVGKTPEELASAIIALL